MIESKDIFGLNFFNYKMPFYGSYKGMRYEIVKDSQNNQLQATVWPGPFAHDKVPEEFKQSLVFSFDEGGRQDMIDWLNERYEAGIDQWRTELFPRKK